MVVEGEEASASESRGPSPQPAPAWRRLIARVRAAYKGSPVEDVAGNLKRMDFGNSTVVFGATMLLAALPLLILVGSYASQHVDQDIAERMGLDRQGAKLVAQLFNSSTHHSISAELVAVILGFASIVSVAGILQVIYERRYGQSHRGMRDLARFVVWVFAFFGLLMAEGSINEAVHSPFVVGIVVFLVVTIFFWWTMYLLLAGRVPWRDLLAPAVFTGLFWLGLRVFGAFYFSSTTISDSTLYGKIGVVFNLTAWLIIFGAMIELGAATGLVWRERRARSRALRATASSDH